MGQAMSAMMNKRAVELLAAAGNDPVMFAYMSDGWGAPVASRTSATFGEHLVLRRGRYRHELLLERGRPANEERLGEVVACHAFQPTSRSWARPIKLARLQCSV